MLGVVCAFFNYAHPKFAVYITAEKANHIQTEIEKEGDRRSSLLTELQWRSAIEPIFELGRNEIIIIMTITTTKNNEQERTSKKCRRIEVIKPNRQATNKNSKNGVNECTNAYTETEPRK